MDFPGDLGGAEACTGGTISLFGGTRTWGRAEHKQRFSLHGDLGYYLEVLISFQRVIVVADGEEEIHNRTGCFGVKTEKTSQCFLVMLFNHHDFLVREDKGSQARHEDRDGIHFVNFDAL